MKRALFAAVLLAGCAAAGPAMALIRQGGVRFPAVTVRPGEALRAIVSNVLIPAAGATPAACPVEVRAFAADGSQIQDRLLNLAAGASAAVRAPLVPGLVRVVVSLAAGFTDPAAVCALKSELELGRGIAGPTRLVVPSGVCIGNGACATTLPPPP
jgi:hypothetical protein